MPDIRQSFTKKLVVFCMENWWRALLLSCILLPAIWIQNKKLNEVRATPQIYRQSLYLPSGKNIHLVSIGYDRFMADFIWLRSIQAFGGHWSTDRNYKPIFHLFDVITDLDPHFIDAYTFGNMVIGDEGGAQRLGLELIDKGMLKNPRKYKLPYWAGYVAYWQLDDPQLARYYYKQAIKAPDCPGFVNRILAYMELKSGRYMVAFEKYLRDWMEGADNEDGVVADIASRRIRDVLNEWYIFIIEQSVSNYVEKMGRDPENIHDLEKAGVVEPYTLLNLDIMGYGIQKYSELPGNVTDHFDEIMRAGSRPNARMLPPHPHGYWYQINPLVHSENEDFILDGQEMVNGLKDDLRRVRYKIKEFYQKQGRYPYSSDEIYGEPPLTEEPLGGEWLYHPHDGVFYSSTMPFL